MLYELRVYEILPGRMPAMLARLERASEVFRQHGFDIAGVWTEVVDGNPRLIYINVYDSLILAAEVGETPRALYEV